MNKILLLFSSLLLFPCFSFAVPKLFFSWGQGYDKVCARGFDYSRVGQAANESRLKMAWSLELRNRVLEFQERWDLDSPALFRILVSEFGKDFSRTEYSASLSACAVAPSMPDPLVLNVSRYLRSYSAPAAPKDMNRFVDLPFHELLHLWLAENFPQDTALKKKYRAEEVGVVSHLHLFALQSFIYEKSGRSDLWTAVRESHIKMGGIHKHALEILEIEGRDQVLQELK